MSGLFAATKANDEGTVSSNQKVKVGVAADDDDEEEEEEPHIGIEVLGEVVGGHNVDWKRVAPDVCRDQVRPYCTVQIGTRILHQTKKAEETTTGRNPVWTVATNAFFLFNATPIMIANETLTAAVWFKRKDSLQLTVLETIGLGQAHIRLADIFQLYRMEDRIDLPLVLNIPSNSSSSGPTSPDIGTLTLRFRLATSLDRHYLSTLTTTTTTTTSEPKNHLLTTRNVFFADAQPRDDPTTTQAISTSPLGSTNKHVLVTETNETEVAGASLMNVLSTALKTRSYFNERTRQEMVLIKPHPDPKCIQETTYLSRSEIRAKTMEPSHEWIKAGSGTIGKVYLELLSCHGLPNMDVAGAAGNLTDAFVAIVYEDAMVQSPVIDDELNPHWMPWTKRAFVFGMMHPSSTLYLAAFDYDLGLSNHDPIGRVAVNVANLQHNTDYTLQYKLYPSSNVTDRTAAGSIKVRVRVEYADEKRALLEALKPRPKFHINVQKEKSLAVLRYTCYGEYGDNNEQPFDLTVVRSYINEILEYKRSVTYCLIDAVQSLIFWRGQVRIGTDLLIPLHSFLFFCMTTTLVERPYLFPSFVLLSIAWVMIAAQTQRMQHPSPWHQSFSLRRYVDILSRGESSPAFDTIQPNQGAKEAQAYDKAWEERLTKDLELAAQQAAMQQEILNLGDEAIHTKIAGGGIPLDLLERLTRYQAIVGRICQKFRLIKIIVTWEESFVSFWLTACVLVIGLVSLLLPWSFILLWTGRIVVYGLFGPHMMLVDKLLSSDSGGGELAVEKAMAKFQEAAFGARIRRQEALKLRDMKCLAFGKYLVSIPTHNLSRHFDRPLASSYATVCARPHVQLASVEVPGQHLFGTVLPRTETDSQQFHMEMARLEKTQKKLQKFLKKHCKDSNNETLDTRTCTISGDELQGFSLQSVDSDEVMMTKESCPTKNVESPNTKITETARTSEEIESSSEKEDTSPYVPINRSKKPSRRVRALLESLEDPLDEARESGEVEVVLSSSGLDREDAVDSDSSEEEEYDEQSITSTVVVEQSPVDWRVLFFQPKI